MKARPADGWPSSSNAQPATIAFNIETVRGLLSLWLLLCQGLVAICGFHRVHGISPGADGDCVGGVLRGVVAGLVVLV